MSRCGIAVTCRLLLSGLREFSCGGPVGISHPCSQHRLSSFALLHGTGQGDSPGRGAVVVSILGPPQRRPGFDSLQGRVWDSSRTMPLVCEFSRPPLGSRTLAFWHCSILISLHAHRVTVIFAICITIITISLSCIEDKYGSMNVMCDEENAASYSENGVERRINVLGSLSYEEVRLAVLKEPNTTRVLFSRVISALHKHCIAWQAACVTSGNICISGQDLFGSVEKVVEYVMLLVAVMEKSDGVLVPVLLEQGLIRRKFVRNTGLSTGADSCGMQEARSRPTICSIPTSSLLSRPSSQRAGTTFAVGTSTVAQYFSKIYAFLFAFLPPAFFMNTERRPRPILQRTLPHPPVPLLLPSRRGIKKMFQSFGRWARETGEFQPRSAVLPLSDVDQFLPFLIAPAPFFLARGWARDTGWYGSLMQRRVLLLICSVSSRLHTSARLALQPAGGLTEY
ncbi:hypothetical protein PR048_018877 [Dryococelus australis]|uniref:Uncharacterized protein n=1 Tax=Dryococelus australis TaxID=614101 RepID=A0ABQ9H201_9NEOP|nr:hypothetical protein PR048_018877 [Dryococelus australis]